MSGSPNAPKSRAAEWFKTPAFQASCLVGLSIGITLVVAYLSTHPKSASGLITLLLVILAGIFQILAAQKFHSIGRADPGLARASVRRLYGLGDDVLEALEMVNVAYLTGTQSSRRDALGSLRVYLDHFWRELGQQVGDWKEFHSDALEEINPA